MAEKPSEKPSTSGLSSTTIKAVDRLKQKLHLPKAKTFASGDTAGLESMVRESMYFVWPVAGISEQSERSLERFLTNEEAIFEGDSDDQDDER